MKKTAIICILLGIIMSMPLMGCNDIKFDPKSMTMEEHADLVYERVQQYYMSENSKYKNTYTDFEVFPLYNQNDELTHFVVEFEPYGFVYLKINYEYAQSVPELYIREDNFKIDRTWQRYTVNIVEERSKIYEINDKGEYIYRYNSHFKEANIERERRYLLEYSYFETRTGRVNGFIPAVKRGSKWLNLVSMEEFELKDEPIKQAYDDMKFYKSVEFCI